MMAKSFFAFRHHIIIIGLGVPVATVFQILACFVFLGRLNKKQALKRRAE